MGGDESKIENIESLTEAKNIFEGNITTNLININNSMNETVNEGITNYFVENKSESDGTTIGEQLIQRGDIIIKGANNFKMNNTQNSNVLITLEGVANIIGKNEFKSELSNKIINDVANDTKLKDFLTSSTDSLLQSIQKTEQQGNGAFSLDFTQMVDSLATAAGGAINSITGGSKEEEKNIITKNVTLNGLKDSIEKNINNTNNFENIVHDIVENNMKNINVKNCISNLKNVQSDVAKNVIAENIKNDVDISTNQTTLIGNIGKCINTSNMFMEICKKVLNDSSNVSVSKTETESINNKQAKTTQINTQETTLKGAPLISFTFGLIGILIIIAICAGLFYLYRSGYFSKNKSNQSNQFQNQNGNNNIMYSFPPEISNQ